MKAVVYDGYSATLNGNTLNVYAPDGHEVMHTFSYNGERNEEGLIASIKSYLHLKESGLLEQICEDDESGDF